MTTVEIVYNILSFIVAVITLVAFTIYARRALNDLEDKEKGSSSSSSRSIGHHFHKEVEEEQDMVVANVGSVNIEMEKLPPERQYNSTIL